MSQCHAIVEQDMLDPMVIARENYSIAMQSVRKPEKRDANDDAAMYYGWPEGACIIAVADGVGGAPLGNQASGIAMRCLQERLGDANPSRDFRPFVMDAIEQANAEILDCQSGSATTLTIAEIRDGQARIYQVGDSMAIVFGSRGRVKYRTVSHSPIGYAVESGLMTDQDAMIHDDRHYISNCVGSREMSIEVGPSISLARRDAVLLGSDGLFDNLNIDEIISLSLKGSARNRVHDLVKESKSRMHQGDSRLPSKPDDLTVVLWLPR